MRSVFFLFVVILGSDSYHRNPEAPKHQWEINNPRVTFPSNGRSVGQLYRYLGNPLPSSSSETGRVWQPLRLESSGPYTIQIHREVFVEDIYIHQDTVTKTTTIYPTTTATTTTGPPTIQTTTTPETTQSTSTTTTTPRTFSNATKDPTTTSIPTWMTDTTTSTEKVAVNYVFMKKLRVRKSLNSGSESAILSCESLSTLYCTKAIIAALIVRTIL